MRIIWIEDEPESMKYFRYALEHQGHEVLFIETYQEFQKLILQDINPDMVLVDIMLPTGDLDPQEAEYGHSTGLIVLRELKEHYPDLIFWIITNRIDISKIELEFSNVKVVSKTNLSPWQFAKSIAESVSK